MCDRCGCACYAYTTRKARRRETERTIEKQRETKRTQKEHRAHRENTERTHTHTHKERERERERELLFTYKEVVFIKGKGLLCTVIATPRRPLLQPNRLPIETQHHLAVVYFKSSEPSPIRPSANRTARPKVATCSVRMPMYEEIVLSPSCRAGTHRAGPTSSAARLRTRGPPGQCRCRAHPCSGAGTCTTERRTSSYRPCHS